MITSVIGVIRAIRVIMITSVIGVISCLPRWADWRTLISSPLFWRQTQPEITDKSECTKRNVNKLARN